MDSPDPPNPEVTADATEADTGQMLGRQDAGSLFPKPVPIFGEDPNAYDELHRRITRDVAPEGAIEELWVKDIVDLAVEADRFRRMKDALLMNAAATILRRRLQNASHHHRAQGPELTTRPCLWCRGVRGVTGTPWPR